MYQAMLVHNVDVQRYRPGREDTMLCVVSSAQCEAGIEAVIREPQAAPAEYRVREGRAPGGLFAFVGRWAAALPAGLAHQAAGREPIAAPASNRSGGGVPDATSSCSMIR